MTPTRRFGPRPRPTRWLAAACLLLTVPATGSAQRGEDTTTLTGRGTDLFRAVLKTAGVEPLTLAQYEERGPRDDTIVVIIGSWWRSDREPVGGEAIAGQVLQAGGAVLYASDTDSDLGQFLGGRTGLRVHGQRVWATDPAARHTPDIPHSLLLVPREPRFADRGPLWELFRGLNRVVAEDASCLVVDRYGGPVQHALAGFPRGARFVPAPPLKGPPEAERHPDRGPDSVRNPFAVGGTGPDRENHRPYRFLALADEAVLINRTIADATTDNLDFACRVVHFLQDPDGKNRTHCLFVQYGDVVPRFDTAYRYATRPPPVNVPLPSFEKVQQLIVDVGNRVIDRAQADDTFNKMLLGPESEPARRHRNLVGLLQTLLVVGAVWAVWFVLRRVWKARQPTEQPRPPAVVPPKPGPPGIFTRREQELIRRNNLCEPVRDTLREFFAAAGAPPGAGRVPSRLAFDSSGGKPARLRKAIDELWAIAFGNPRVLTVYQWQELEPKFGMVRQAFEDGIWRFEGAAAATERGDG